MGKILLVTGGARSGKSTYAESLAKESLGKVLYLATAIALDEEMKDRVKKHRASRPNYWGTFEGYKKLDRIFDKEALDYDTILLDCITIMVTNLIFDNNGENMESFCEDQINNMEKTILEEVANFILAAEKSDKTVILVTNEIGYGLVPEYKLGRVFRDIAGRVNQYIAQRATEVILVVCGIPVKVK